MLKSGHNTKEQTNLKEEEVHTLRHQEALFSLVVKQVLLQNWHNVIIAGQLSRYKLALLHVTKRVRADMDIIQQCKTEKHRVAWVPVSIQTSCLLSAYRTRSLAPTICPLLHCCCQSSSSC